MNVRTVALAACLATGFALPTLAQTATPDAAPATSSTVPAEAPLPDTGIKKTAPETRTHHRTHHHQHAKAATAATPPVHARA